MEAEPSTEFQDWELLHNPDSAIISSSEFCDSLIGFQGVEAESEVVIRPDYFSIDNQIIAAKTTIPVAVMSDEEGSVESDNPSWVDPGSENRYQMNNSGEFLSDLGSDRFDDRKFSGFDVKRDVGLIGIAESGVGSEGIGGIEDKSEKSIQFNEIDGNKESGLVNNKKNHDGFEGFSEIHGEGEDLGQLWSDIGKETEGCFPDHLTNGDESNISTENNGQDVADVEFEAGNGQSSAIVEEIKPKVQSDGDETKSMVWWKVPIEVMKYCLFKVSPVWTLSMAAAVMGIVILGRRLHIKMRRKAHALELKLAVDDKKVSQAMSRVARLNEAFSVVRRVPMVRPPLPAAGLNTWPAMSLR